MRMKWAIGVALSTLISAGQLGAKATLTEKDRAAILKTLDEAMKVAKLPSNPQITNWNAFCEACYSDSAILMVPSVPPIRGRSVITGAYNSLPNWKSFTPKIETLDGEGDTAYAIGLYETVIQVSPEKQMTDKGKYLEIWEKQSDGSWKIILESFSSDQPH